ncbi:hypothetical protein LCGC14_2157220 [marine sediment metagenome]|uniref:AP2/ERF domain-containing protein n=1 Tax=marine sediment metagenome TaxID=412755 RepID=A0A0F9DTP0_9ZZZZ
MNNLVGQKFGRLIVLKRMDNDKWGHLRWLCKCDCGKKIIAQGHHLKDNHTQSCGCLAKEQLIERSTTHGHTTRRNISKTYVSWLHVIQRCTNPNDKRYKDYGGRGIKVCKRWMKFENFLEDMGKIPEGYSIDRINNNKGYKKSNCKWSTKKEQSRNTRRNRSGTYGGKTQLLIEWSEETGIPYSTLWQRIYRLGWSIEKALTTPAKKGDRYE